MNVVSLMGSPRKKGNTATVLTWVEETLTAAGHAVDRHCMDGYAVAGCQECQHCKQGKVELCNIYDDGIVLLNKIIDADMLLLSAPVFCWGFPGPLKTLLDRMYCLAIASKDGTDYTSRIKGKPIGLIVTAGGPEKDNADLLVKAYTSMCVYMKAIPAGALVVPNCIGAESLDAAVQSRAVAYGRKLAAMAD